MAGPWEAFQSEGPWTAFAKGNEPVSAPNAGRSRFDDVGRGEAALRGAGQGVTFNFGDELTGASAASGITSQHPLARAAAPVVGMGRLGYEALAGEGDATKRYQEAVERERELTKQAREQQPGAYTAGEIGGAVAIPAGGLLRASTLFGRALRGAGVGAGFGAISGAGEGETLPERVTKSATGGLVGAGVGAVAPPLVEGAVRAAGAAISTPVNLIRGALNPQGAAEKAVGRALLEAGQADPTAVNRLTAGSLGPDSPAIAMDVLGQPGRNLARSASNLSGAAGDVLNQTLNPRLEQQVPRVTGWLRATFHYPDVGAQQQAIDAVEKTVNKGLYRRAYTQGDKGVWSSELERLTSSPDIVAAMREAATKGKSRAVAEGFGGFNPGVTVDNGGIVTFQRGPTGQPTYPNLQFWDYTKRALGDAESAAGRAGRKDEADYLGQLRRALVSELDQIVPAYSQARSGASKFFKAEHALEAGQKYVNENFANAETRRVLAGMSQTERQLFQDGFVSRLVETLGNIPDRADIVRRIYNTPNAKEKIVIALGPQRAAELEAMLRVENIMQQGLRAVQGNSTTALQIGMMGLAGATGGGFLGFDPTASGISTALATAGKKGIDARVANRIAELLTSNDPAALRKGAQMFASNKRLMEVLRALDSGAAKVGGQQARLPAITPQGAGRTEDDDPSVPRPIGQ